MGKLKIYIVEDDPLIAFTIETALKKQGYSICGITDNFEEALEGISKNNPQLVLVDIQLDGEKDGVHLAEKLDTLKIPYLYLTSQTDPHTIQRVKETRPLGYIVKPFTENGLRSNIEIAWNNYKNDEEYLSFSANNELYKIRQSQILYLKAFDNYCYVITQEREYLVPKTLKFLAAQLNAEKFTKTHRSYFVNLLKIDALRIDSLLINGFEIPVSNSKKTTLKQLLQSK
ncbi:LytR/AlgR family response regulator transcription factor [Aequorivita lipolytica]|uniref:Response regulator transcription factor n=1 Tax=Aequorivita lipolytica TaxID=153267 RepID=A0A5C6YT09_9FLAO|nr:response regulator [Aequorivita lipolytica]TXD70568.1 response regulator transcription factor [Aequorivita lipolytica]SRX49596.1 Transcriptional regulatory protein YpdB [Aequorivita lipolytica]